MTRLALAIAAGLLCGLAGMRQSAALQSEASRLRRWHELLMQLALILQERSVSLPEALRIAADRSLQPDRVMHTLAARMHLHPLEALADSFDQSCPPLPEKAALMRMCVHLGQGTLESRTQAVHSVAGEISLMAAAASARADKDARLWRTLGWLGGACLALLLI